MTGSRPLAAAALWRAMFAAVVFLATALPGRADDKLLGLRLENHSGKTRIVLDLSGKLPYSIFTLADPYRVVIDLPAVEWSAKSQSANANANDGLVSGYRFGLFQPGNSRFVLDLRQPAQIANVFFMAAPPGATSANSGASRLVIDLTQTNRDRFMTTAGFKGRNSLIHALPPAAGKTALAPPSSAAPKARPAPPAAAPQIPRPGIKIGVAAPVPPPNPRRAQPPSVTAAAGAPLAIRPLAPAGKAAPPRTIVIDAGHGGVDPGAITAQGVYEKTIVLDVARRLQTLLSRDRRNKVVMTRDSDVFVRLGDRVKIARDSQAGLFVSIHADALATRKIRGASVYTLSEQASDNEAELLAAKENSSDMIAGIGIGDETDELVKTILIDLAQRETTNKSVHFAKLLLPQLNGAGALLKNSHRYAGFKVLKAPDVPSVLVEIGLLSNSADAKILTSPVGRQRLAEALKGAIDAYFRNFET